MDGSESRIHDILGLGRPLAPGLSDIDFRSLLFDWQ